MHSVDGSTYRFLRRTESRIFPFLAYERLQEVSAPVLSSLFAHKQASRLNVVIPARRS